MISFPFSSDISNLRNIYYTPQISSLNTTQERVYIPSTGVFQVDYTYLDSTNTRRWKTIELEGYLKVNDYCTVLKEAIDTIYKQNKEGREFVITSIKQK